MTFGSLTMCQVLSDGRQRQISTTSASTINFTICSFFFVLWKDSNICLSFNVLLFSLHCGLHGLLFCTGVRSLIKCPGYNTKQSHGEATLMLELWGMLIYCHAPGLLWSGVVASERVLFMGQIELICVIMLNRLFRNRTVFISKCVNKKIILKWIVWKSYRNGLIRRKVFIYRKKNQPTNQPTPPDNKYSFHVNEHLGYPSGQN